MISVFKKVWGGLLIFCTLLLVVMFFINVNQYDDYPLDTKLSRKSQNDINSAMRLAQIEDEPSNQELEKEIIKLKREIKSFQLNNNGSTSSDAMASLDGRQLLEGGVITDSPDSLPDQPATPEQMIVSLEHVLNTEAYDAEWAEPLEVLADEILFDKPYLEGNDLTSMECRTTICRIEFSHENDEVREKMLSSLAAGSELQEILGDFYLYPVASEHSVYNTASNTIIFFSRKGHELPVSLVEAEENSIMTPVEPGA